MFFNHFLKDFFGELILNKGGGSLVVARAGLELKSVFLGPKSWLLAQISDICNTTPILVNGLFVALGERVYFPYW